MKRKFGTAMFDTIKDALDKTDERGASSFDNVMKFPAGKTYTVRLLPNPDDPEATFFHHYSHGWKSIKTGKYVSSLSLQTFGEPDPITDLFWKLIKSDDKDEKERGKIIRRRESWFVNIYVVDDPSNPENNGTVKVLRVGPQLKEKIDTAMSGALKDDFGQSVFSINDEGEFDPTIGANLKIVAEKQGDYTTYANSVFTKSPKIKLSDEEIDTIFEGLHDLTVIYPAKTYDELEETLKVHFLGVEASEARSEVNADLSVGNNFDKKVDEATDTDDMDAIPFADDKPSADDASIDDLIKGI